MAELDHTAEDLFFKLRNRFPRINMGDENGKVTTNPMATRFFNFRYEHEGRRFGQVTCSLIDGNSLKVFFSQDITQRMDEEQQSVWFQFLKELRKFAKINMLSFDVRDISKGALDQRDIQFVSQYHKEKADVNESKITWERKGRFSEGNHKNIKIHVVHKNRMDENPNNRLLQVDKIYLVNENHERFLLPFTSISAAKAMANHVGRGGTPYDASGQTIVRAVSEMKNLGRFVTAMRNKTFEHAENALPALRASRHIKEQIKTNLKKMAGVRNFEEGLEGLNKILNAEATEGTVVLKDWFVQKTYNENLDAWLESATNAIKRCEEMNMDLSRDDDPITEENNDDPILDKDHTAKRAANPAQIGNTVPMYADPAKDEEMRALIKSQPMRGMVRLILADIATRAVDDETAILASKADEGEFTLKHKKMIEAYLKDLYSGNPDRQEHAAKKDLYGKVKGPEKEFEETIMGMGESEEEEMEAIGDRHKTERFKSLKKIKNRLGEEEPEEDVEEGLAGAAWELGKGAVKVPAKAIGRAVGSAASGVAKGAGQVTGGALKGVGSTLQGKPFTGIGQAVKGAAVGAGQAIGGTLKGVGKAVAGAATDLGQVGKDMKRAYKGVKEGEEMDAGQCNESPEGTMCPVHGMQECSGGGVAVTIAEKEQTMEDIKNMLRLAGVVESKKPDADGDGVPDWADKKSGKDDDEEDKVEESNEISWMKKLAGLNENYIYAQDDEETSESEEEGDVEEGNEFSGERAKAVAAHKDHFEVGGKTYKVTEVDMSEEGEEEVEEASKPDFLDMDKDGNKEEPMKKAIGDKEKTDEALEILKKAAGIW